MPAYTMSSIRQNHGQITFDHRQLALLQHRLNRVAVIRFPVDNQSFSPRILRNSPESHVAVRQYWNIHLREALLFEWRASRAGFLA